MPSCHHSNKWLKLLYFAFHYFSIPPHIFWEMTPQELMALASSPEVISKEEIEELKQMFSK